jgi:predicted RNase H-like HicB family nuclease
MIWEYKTDYMSNYEIILYCSIEDNAFIAGIPELDGCMADGKTYIEAVQNAEIAIGEWIETARLMNRAIPAARGKLVYA